jgi:protein ImuB
MRLGEALATCPSLQLVDRDPATAEEGWEQIVRRLEDAGFAVDPATPGCAYFDTRGVERLYGGLEPALKRALAAVGPGWDARIGAAGRRFAALAAANVARSGQALVVSDERTREFLAPLPLKLLPVDERRREELEELGVKKLGQLAGLPGGAVAERLGPDGRRAWSLARGGSNTRVRGRTPAAELGETLEFPEAVGNELTLRRSLAVLLDRLLARPERGGRAPRKLALSARLVGGGSWRRTITLRDATAEPSRLRAALAPKLLDLPAPVVMLKLEALVLAESTGQQLELVRPEGDELRTHLREGLRQVRVGTGSGSVCTVVEVAPWSRLPEQRALLVPRDE